MAVFKGMLSMAMGLMIMMMNPTPTSMSFFVVATSLIVSSFVLLFKMNSLLTASLVISFSSGMMILFCYCAMLSSYEKKSKPKTMLMFLAYNFILVVSCSDNLTDQTNMSEQMIPMLSIFLLVAMSSVILAMVSINKCVFHPTKTSMASY